MGNLVYLAAAVLAVVVISLVLLVRERRPVTVESEVDRFSRGLQALSPQRSRASGPDRRA
jgi:hypothetical protein